MFKIFKKEKNTKKLYVRKGVFMKPHINIFWMIAGVFFVLMLIAGFWKIYKDRKKKTNESSQR